jgi:hypothetical protein
MGLIDPVRTGGAQMFGLADALPSNVGHAAIAIATGDQNLFRDLFFSSEIPGAEDPKGTVVSIQGFNTGHVGTGFSNFVPLWIAEQGDRVQVPFRD